MCFLLCNLVNAQETEYKKNAGYISFGTVIFSSQASLSYERTIYEKDLIRTKFKINYGKYISNNLDQETDSKVYNNYKSVSGVFLFNQFEFNLGIAFTEYKLVRGFEPDPSRDYDEVINGSQIYGNIGVRYEKNNFLMRAGIGNLELLYAGVGFSF